MLWSSLPKTKKEAFLSSKIPLKSYLNNQTVHQLSWSPNMAFINILCDMLLWSALELTIAVPVNDFESMSLTYLFLLTLMLPDSEFFHNLFVDLNGIFLLRTKLCASALRVQHRLSLDYHFHFRRPEKLVSLIRSAFKSNVKQIEIIWTV